MSLASWKREFYPCSAESKQAKRKPAAHSLRKWQGLTRANRRRHGLVLDVDDGLLHEVNSNKGLWIDADSCALCLVYYAHDSLDVDDRCGRCPLAKVRNGASCAIPMDGETRDPFLAGIEGNVAPMLKWLRRAVKLEGAK